MALYFLPDPKLVELGLVPADDHAEIVRTEYEYYARNALVQLRRVREGTTIEEDHMRNRHMIVNWLTANTEAIQIRKRDGKTFFVLTDVDAFREGVARLLAEVQRIKAEGDYPAARALFETYGVHFDRWYRETELHAAGALPRTLEDLRGRGHVYEEAFEVKIRNHKTEDVVVEVVEPLPSEWTMLAHSHGFEKLDAFTVQFDVPVEAGEETVLTYRVRIEF